MDDESKLETPGKSEFTDRLAHAIMHLNLQQIHEVVGRKHKQAKRSIDDNKLLFLMFEGSAGGYTNVLDVARCLIVKYRTNPHVVDAKGNNLLHHAINVNSASLVRFLLEIRVSHTHYNVLGYPPHFFVRDSGVQVLQVYAQMRIDLTFITKSLDHAMNILQYALQNRMYSVVRALLELGLVTANSRAKLGMYQHQCEVNDLNMLKRCFWDRLVQDYMASFGITLVLPPPRE